MMATMRTILWLLPKIFAHPLKAIFAVGLVACAAPYTASQNEAARDNTPYNNMPYASGWRVSHQPALPVNGDDFIAPPPRRAGATIVALLLPMSDQREDVRLLADAMFNAAQMALFDSGMRSLVLSLHDTQGTAKGAALATREALAGGAQLILGPLFSTSVTAAAPYLRGRKVAALAFSNNIDVLEENIWLMGFLPEQNIDHIVGTAIAQGLTRFAALVPEGDFGVRTLAALNDSLALYGGTLVDAQNYPPDGKAMFEPVRQLARFDRRKQTHEAEMQRLKAEARRLVPEATADDEIFTALEARAPELVSAYEALKLSETLGEIPYDVVFIPEGGLNLRNLAPLLPYFDIDPKLVKFVGTGLWDDPTLAKEPPLHGAWYAAPDARNYRIFATRYKQFFNAVPPRLAGLAYDGVALAAQLHIMNGGSNKPFERDLLTDPNGFVGVDGIFRFLPNGYNERGLAVREITAKRPREIDPAPTSFVEHSRRRMAVLALTQNPAPTPPQQIDTTQDISQDTAQDISQDRPQNAPQNAQAGEIVPLDSNLSILEAIDFNANLPAIQP